MIFWYPIIVTFWIAFVCLLSSHSIAEDEIYVATTTIELTIVSEAGKCMKHPTFKHLSDLVLSWKFKHLRAAAITAN